MTPDNRLSRHVHGFFHEYLTTQRNVSPHTVFSYRDTLKLFLSYASQQLSTPVVDLSLDVLTPDLVLGFLNHLETERSNTAATRNVRLAALHVFFRYVGAHDPLSFDNCQRIVSIPKKRTTAPATDYLEREEIEDVLSRIDRRTPAGRRDYAMLSFTYQTGARVQEVIGVRASDLELESLPQVRIWGKGRKERVLPLWNQTAALLRALLEERNVDPRSSQLVFVNMRGRPMTRWVFDIFSKSTFLLRSGKAPWRKSGSTRIPFDTPWRCICCRLAPIPMPFETSSATPAAKQPGDMHESILR